MTRGSWVVKGRYGNGILDRQETRYRSWYGEVCRRVTKRVRLSPFCPCSDDPAAALTLPVPISRAVLMGSPSHQISIFLSNVALALTLPPRAIPAGRRRLPLHTAHSGGRSSGLVARHSDVVIWTCGIIDPTPTVDSRCLVISGSLSLATASVAVSPSQDEDSCRGLRRRHLLRGM